MMSMDLSRLNVETMTGCILDGNMKTSMVTESEYQQQVRNRDRHHCRWCEAALELGQILSIYGRHPDLLHEVRTSILLCSHCYDTIQRGDWCVRGLSHFQGPDGRRLINANDRIVFEPAND